MKRARSIFIFALPLSLCAWLVFSQFVAPYQDALGLHRAQLEQAAQLNARLKERVAVTQIVEGFPGLPPNLIWAASGPSSPAERFQKELVDRLDGLGVQISRFRLDVDDLGNGMTVGFVTVEAQGTLTAITRLLAEADARAPQFAVPNITIRALPERSQVDGATMVAASFRAMAFLEAAS